MGKRKIKLSEDMLIRAIREKNELGARALYDMYSGAIYGTIIKIVRETHLAQDVLQEAFLRIWNNFDKYDAAKARLFTWMINLARNLAIDHIRSKDFRKCAQQVSLEEAVESIPAPESPYQPLEYQTARRLIATLQFKEQQVLDMIYFKGFKHTEVAETLNMQLGSVKTCCRSGLRKLRSLYADDILILNTAS